jgi:hypothetical protein
MMRGNCVFWGPQFSVKMGGNYVLGGPQFCIDNFRDLPKELSFMLPAKFAVFQKYATYFDPKYHSELIVAFLVAMS